MVSLPPIRSVPLDAAMPRDERSARFGERQRWRPVTGSGVDGDDCSRRAAICERRVPGRGPRVAEWISASRRVIYASGDSCPSASAFDPSKPAVPDLRRRSGVLHDRSPCRRISHPVPPGRRVCLGWHSVRVGRRVGSVINLGSRRRDDHAGRIR